MGLEALGNAIAFPRPSALRLSGAGRLLWEAKEGVLVAPTSQGANFSEPNKGAGELQLLHP